MKRLLLTTTFSLLLLSVFSQSDNKQKLLKEISRQEKVLQKKPDDAKALSKIAISYYKLQDFSTAISYYDRLIAWNPKVAGAYANRGMCKLLIGNKQGACADFSQSIANGENPKLIENKSLSEYLANECGK